MERYRQESTRGAQEGTRWVQMRINHLNMVSVATQLATVHKVRTMQLTMNCVIMFVCSG